MRVKGLKRFVIAVLLTLGLIACAQADRPSGVPAAPTNVRATPGEGQVELSWTDSAGATGYNVYRSESSSVEINEANRRNPTLVMATSFTDGEVEGGKTYHYVVTAVGTGGESGASERVEATLADEPIAPPANLAAEPGDREVRLSWQESAGATGYHVYRSMTAGFTHAEANRIASNHQQLTYTDTELENNTEHFYAVTAVGHGEVESEPTRTSATPTETPAIQPPPAPTNVRATPGEGQVELSWAASAGAIGYNIYRSESPNVETNPANRRNPTVHTMTTFSDSGVTTGGTYYYVVTAIGASGIESGASNEVMVALEPQPEPVGAWRTLPASAKNRQEVSYVQLGGRFYLTGGLGEGDTLHEVYNPATRTWTAVTPLPQGLDHIQGVALDGRIYYIGGLSAWPGPHASAVYIYNPETDSFSQGAPMPRGRGAGGVAAHNGKIYYAGGMHGERRNAQAVAWFDVYDPATNSWQELPDMPRVRDHFHAVVLDGVLYAIGGRDTDIDAVTPAVDAYNFATGSWTTLDTELPTPRGGFAAAVLGDEILIIGGEGGGNTYAQVEAYRPATNSWRRLAPMLTPRHGIQAAVCNGGVYIAAGGRVQGGGSPSNVHEVFFLDGERPCQPDDTGPPPNFTRLSWSTVAPNPQRRNEAQGKVVDGKLYVFGGYNSFTPVTVIPNVDVYDPATNTWTTLDEPMPTLLTHIGAALDGRDIYFAGGYVGREGGGQIFATDEVWKFNVDSHSWTPMPPLPEARGSGGLAIVGREMHFFGGSDIRRRDRSEHWILSLDNPQAGWRDAPALVPARNHHAAVTLGGKIYSIGGQQGQDEAHTAQHLVTVWDPQTNAWADVAPLPRPLSHISASVFVMGERIIVAGGEIAHNTPVADVWAYSPSENSWTQLTSLPAARRSGVAGAINNEIIFTSGGSPGFRADTYRGVPID